MYLAANFVNNGAITILGGTVAIVLQIISVAICSVASGPGVSHEVICDSFN